MNREQVVNDQFVQALQTVYAEPEMGPTVVKSLLFALGEDRSLTPEGAPPAGWEAKFPILGFYVQATDGVFVAYVLTPGRFIRYEAANGADLTITVPLKRLSRVEARTTSQGVLQVVVELDADNVTVLQEYRQSYGEDDHEETIFGQARGQVARANYQLEALLASPEGTRLREFGRVLRSVLGA